MTKTTLDQYAVLGHPIAHSKSPQIHAEFAKQTGQQIEYKAILVDVDGLAQALSSFEDQGGKGVNITLPFKREAWEWVDSRSPRAQRAGAVNTIVFSPDASYGDNTDGVGLVRDLTVNYHVALKASRILLLGAGGACRGVIEPLLAEHPAHVAVVNRTSSKALELAQTFADLGAIEALSYDDLADKKFDLIINATSASLKGELPPLPCTVLVSGGGCYDMMYGATPTVFMQWAKANGASKAMDGLGMLVEQAAESFFLWRKVRPQTAPVMANLRAQMATLAT